MVAMFSTGDTSAVEEVVSPEYLDHQGLRGGAVDGPEGFAAVVTAARQRYVRLEVTLEDVIAGGDRVAARLRWTGTRMDGEVVQRETIEILRVEAGKAVEHWGGRC